MLARYRKLPRHEHGLAPRLLSFCVRKHLPTLHVTCLGSALFDRYKEPDADTIQVSGVERLCADLQVEPTDAIMLVIAWQMKCETMCVFTRQEWSAGMTAMGVDSIDALRSAFPDLRAKLDDSAAFRDYYTFCFGFAKEPGVGVRTLPIEVATQMWTRDRGAGDQVDIAVCVISLKPFHVIP